MIKKVFKTIIGILCIVLINNACSSGANKKPDQGMVETVEQDSAGSLEAAIHLIDTHQEEQGIKIVNYLIKSADDSLSYLYHLKAMGYYRMKDFSKSMKAINQSIEADSLNYRSYACKGDIYQKTGNLDSALICYQKAEVGLAHDPFLLNNMGTLCTTMKDFVGAKRNFLKIVVLSPNDPDYLYNLGYTYYKLEEYDSALLFVDRGIKVKDTDAGLYNLKGRILGKQGKDAGAIKAFERSIELQPENNTAVENLRIIKSGNLNK